MLTRHAGGNCMTAAPRFLHRCSSTYVQVKSGSLGFGILLECAHQPRIPSLSAHCRMPREGWNSMRMVHVKGFTSPARAILRFCHIQGGFCAAPGARLLSMHNKIIRLNVLEVPLRQRSESHTGDSRQSQSRPLKQSSPKTAAQSGKVRAFRISGR